MAIIDAKEIHKTYDTGKIQVKALKGVDLKIEKGEMIAVMGPSGCGKTTLLNCLSGLDDLTEGSVHLEGNNIHDMKDNPRTESLDQIMEDILSGMERDSASLYLIRDRGEAIRQAVEQSGEGEIIAIIGKGHENYQLIGTEKIYRSEEVV